jgi:hypothetical protein
MFPPVELHVFEDQPEQMELESPSLIPPPLVASVSDQMVKGPPIVRRFTLAEVRTLRLDFRISSCPTPEIVMFAPAVKSLLAPEAVRYVEPKVAMLAEVVTVAQLTVKSAARLIAPLEFVNAPLPEQVRVRLFAEALVSPVETVMFPELSILMFLAVMAETKSEAKMFVVDAEVAWKTPSTKEPWVDPEAVMFMVVAVKLGVIETEVLMNSSAVILSV